ncbi:MAG: hypothetical protein ACSHX0_01615 [Akkermansiaceae bacterium]
MSKKKPSSDGADQAPDLSALDFGPAWARNEPKKTNYKSRGNERRSSNSSEGSGSRPAQRRDDRPQHNNRRDFQKGARSAKPYTPPVAPPEGVIARIMPIEDGLDAMAKQILDTGRTHSVFELAWVVLGGLERFHVVFESTEGKVPLFRSKTNHSVWLNESECLANFWSSGLHKNYYDQKEIEIDPPSGNFPSVARCGISKRLLAPPNYHGYQQMIIDLHREQFSNMDIEHYKSRLIMEKSEEVVQEWLNSMKKSYQWTEKLADTNIENTQSSEAATGETADSVETTEVPTTAEEEVTPAEAKCLTTRREVEQHFLANAFKQEYEQNKVSSAPANVPRNMINPGLLTLAKNTIAEEKRYPGKLASILCRQMTGRHLAVFKWKKRLHCGPARPKQLSDSVILADRPTALYKWVVANPSGNIDQMWKDCLPVDIDDKTKHLWYHDLHWLINEGQVLFFSDGKLHTAKEKAAQPKKTVKSDKKVAPQEATAEKKDPEKIAPEEVPPEAEAPAVVATEVNPEKPPEGVTE